VTRGLAHAPLLVMRFGFFLIACLGCTSTQPKPVARKGWVDHMQSADRHDRRAAEHERAAAAVEGAPVPERFDCGDPDLNDQLTTGGLRVTTWQPCFDQSDETAERHREAAMHEHDLARKDRAAASRLADAERLSCEGVPARELARSPFSHAKSIDRVEPMYDGTQLAGVRIIFKPVRGLNAAWLQRDIACQRARWAVFGKDPTWLPGDPSLVDGVAVDVFDRDGHVEVTVTTKQPDQAAVALARARGELGKDTAKR